MKSFLYRILSVLNDLTSILNGTPHKRAVRKSVFKGTSNFFKKL